MLKTVVDSNARERCLSAFAALRFAQVSAREPDLDRAGVDVARDGTRSEQAERRILAARDELLAALAAAPELLLEMELDGRVVRLRPVDAQMATAADAGQAGATLSDLFPADAADFIASALRDACERGVWIGKQFELQLPKAGLPLALSVFRRSGDSQGPPRFTVVLRDLRASEQEHDALRESEERYRVMFDRARDGMFLLSADGELLSVNESFVRMHGYETAEALPRNLKDLDTPETFRLFPARMSRLLAGEALTFEVEHYHVDGHVFPLEVSVTPMSCAGKSFLLCNHRDITERKAAEEARRKREAELLAVLESAADGILAVDTEGRVLHANRRFVELWRIPAQLMARGDDQAMLDFVLDQLADPDAFLKQVERLYHSDEVSMDTLVFKDGRSFECYSVAMKTQGVRVGRVWSFRDVTERKVAERERRFIEAQLREAQKMGLVRRICGRAPVRVAFQVCDTARLPRRGTCGIRTIF